MERIDQLIKFCEQHTGEHYSNIMLDDAPVHWLEYWPIVDGKGNLTGNVYESGNLGNYANVDDLAMVNVENLTKNEQKRVERETKDGTFDGYVSVEEKATEDTQTPSETR